MAQALTIGQVAKTTGVAAKTIRYYEQIGILPAPNRTASGYRLYDPLGVERVRFIRRARSLGLPLRRLKALTHTVNGNTRPALRPRLLALVQEQLSAVRHQLVELDHLRQQLEHVSRRMQITPGRRRAGPCRCLESDNGTPGRRQPA